MAAHRAQPDDPDDGGRPDALAVSNLPASVSAAQIAQVYRDAGGSEGLFLRLEEGAAQRGRPPGSARGRRFWVCIGVLAHNVLSL